MSPSTSFRIRCTASAERRPCGARSSLDHRRPCTGSSAHPCPTSPQACGSTIGAYRPRRWHGHFVTVTISFATSLVCVGFAAPASGRAKASVYPSLPLALLLARPLGRQQFCSGRVSRPGRKNRGETGRSCSRTYFTPPIYRWTKPPPALKMLGQLGGCGGHTAPGFASVRWDHHASAVRRNRFSRSEKPYVCARGPERGLSRRPESAFRRQVCGTAIARH
jgi:hypothetical protein